MQKGTAQYVMEMILTLMVRLLKITTGFTIKMVRL